MSEIMYELSDGVRLRNCCNPAFKTMRLSVNMIVPISRENAARYAILPSLVSRAVRRYPSYMQLSRRLAELYGASLGSSVQRLGEYQVLGVSAGGISSRYAFGKEDMLAELTQLLFSVIFDTLRDSEGLFPLDGFTQEKRQQLEQKDADLSDKAVYAHQRCHELVFEGCQAGIDRLGSREDIEALSREELNPAWQRLLSQARFEIFALGDCKVNPQVFSERFAGLGKARELDRVGFFAPKMRRLTQTQPIAQSKLSMAFRADVPGRDRLAFNLMSAVLGEPTSSKLFVNVRERQGLCYYCDSSFSWSSGTLYIESAVETEDLARAEEAILDQLRALRRGDVTREELEAAKLYLCSALYSVGDSLDRMEGWHMGRAFDGMGYTPEEAARAVMSYTLTDVVEAANRLEPAAVFVLKGGES